MITSILSLVLFAVFTVLGLIHFYWLFGGKWGIEKVIPTKVNGATTFSPPKLATFVVGATLVLFGLMYLFKSGLIKVQIQDWLADSAYWIIPSIFILRAIGDFNYVGFFKKIKGTAFAKADSKLFSPLCASIGIVGLILFYQQ